MSWGKGISIFIIAFICIMLGMVWLASKQSIEMIDSNYYQKEVAFQGVIDGRHRLKEALAGKAFILNLPEKVQLQFPVATVSKVDSGYIELLKLDNQKFDMKVVLNPNAEAVQDIPKKEFREGKYRIRVLWSNEGQTYYHEDDLFF
jgi:hypothetical protein